MGFPWPIPTVIGEVKSAMIHEQTVQCQLGKHFVLAWLYIIIMIIIIIMEYLSSANLWYTPELGALYRKTR